MLLSEMKIFEAYTIMSGVASLVHLIGLAMAASVILCCAKCVVKTCVRVFNCCYNKGHRWYWTFILAGKWECRPDVWRIELVRAISNPKSEPFSQRNLASVYICLAENIARTIENDASVIQDNYYEICKY